MALFPQQYFTLGGLNDRTHTNLVRSEGMSPAEKWILDPDLPGLFEYRFGGFGMVVVPKGAIVSVTAPKYDWETEKIVNCLTIANGANTPIGVAPYNFYEKNKDRMGDNQLSIENRTYIEVPYFHNADATAQGASLSEMRWGCASSRIFNSTYTTNTLAMLSAGDFVKPDGKGRFVKWFSNKPMTQVFTDATGDTLSDVVLHINEPIKPSTTVTITEEGQETAIAGANITVWYGSAIITVAKEGLVAADKDLTVNYTSALSDPVEQMVGQTLAVETDLPPLGWLAYFMDIRQDADNELNNAMKQTSYPPAAEGGYPAYGYAQNYVSQMKKLFDAQSPKGIPFLTDGYFRAKKTYGASTPVAINSLAAAGVTPFSETANVGFADANGTLAVPVTARDTNLYIKMKAPIAVDGDIRDYSNSRGFTGIKVYFDGVQVAERKKYHVDYKNDTVILLLDANDNGKVVTITCALIEDQLPGLPTEWDYSGTIGAIRVLLCK